MVAMDGDTAIDDLPPTPVSFKSQVIYEEIDIEFPCKPYQGGQHLLSRANGVYQIDALIQSDIRRKDIIEEERDVRDDAGVPDIGAKNPTAGIPDYPCSDEIVSNFGG
jgi:hypothetical protein